MSIGGSVRLKTVGSICAGLILFIALAVWGGRWSARKDERVRIAIEALGEAQEHARLARTVASVALADAERLDSAAKALDAKAKREEAAADGYKRIADSLNKEFEKRAADSPPDCAPVIESARLTIATRDREIGSLRISLGAATHRGDTLEKALALLKPATAGLIAADAKLDTAATNVSEEVRPKFLRRMVNAIAEFGRPKFGVGATCGYDIHGKLNCVGGPSLGWTF